MANKIISVYNLPPPFAKVWRALDRHKETKEERKYGVTVKSPEQGSFKQGDPYSQWKDKEPYFFSTNKTVGNQIMTFSFEVNFRCFYKNEHGAEVDHPKEAVEWGKKVLAKIVRASGLKPHDFRMTEVSVNHNASSPYAICRLSYCPDKTFKVD